MKNIYLLPTDKPSRLVLDTINNNLFTTTTKDFGTNIMKFQNIYITSDEVIKKGDWACHTCITNDKYQIIRCNTSNDLSIQEHWNKIILTTDQELINDGVQSIDGIFLEWFVKNMNCRKVEVVKGVMKLNDDGEEYGFPDMTKYKIIIPKEEQKQHLIDMMNTPLENK